MARRKQKQEVHYLDMAFGNVEGRDCSPLQAIKFYCWGCMGGHEEPWETSDGKAEPPYRPRDEVRECPSTTCWLYPLRFGRNPNMTRSKGSI